MYDLNILEPHCDMNRLTVLFTGGLLPNGQRVTLEEEYKYFLSQLTGYFGEYRLTLDCKHNRWINKFKNGNIHVGLPYFGNSIISFNLEKNMLSPIYYSIKNLVPLSNYWKFYKHRQKVSFKSTEISFDYCVDGKDYDFHKELMLRISKMIRPKEAGVFELYLYPGKFEYLPNGIINGDLTIYFNKLSIRNNRNIKVKAASYIKKSYKIYCKFINNRWLIRFEITLYDDGTNQLIKFFRPRSIFRIEPHIKDKRFTDYFEFLYIDCEGFIKMINNYSSNFQYLSAYKSCLLVNKNIGCVMLLDH